MRFYASFPTRSFKSASLSLDVAKLSVLPGIALISPSDFLKQFP